MSKYIATRAIRGANALVAEAEAMLKQAPSPRKGRDTRSQFPNTAYFLPVINGMLGWRSRHAGRSGTRRSSMPKSCCTPCPATTVWSPYLGETLDCGQATLLAAEAIEAIRFVHGEEPGRYPGL